MINTLIKIYNNRVYTNFQNNIIPKNNESFICLSVILLDSNFVNSDKQYYLQTFVAECKKVKKTTNKIINRINEDLEWSESNDDKCQSLCLKLVFNFYMLYSISVCYF